jgi:hypothetical protein
MNVQLGTLLTCTHFHVTTRSFLPLSKATHSLHPTTYTSPRKITMLPNEKTASLNSGDISLPTAFDDPPAYATTAVASSSTSNQTRFASISLHREDTLRFLRFPPELVSIYRQTITGVWKKGIQSECPYAGSHEVKLRGNPWHGVSEPIDARRLICALLGTMHTQGWVLTLNTDVSKKVLEKDTLLFRYQYPAPAECEWASIAFSNIDRVKFIDCEKQATAF